MGLVGITVLAASVVLQGSRLGRLIESSLPANRGKLEIGGVTWRLRALADLVTDAPSPITVDGLRIIDPEGTVVLDVPHLEARVKLRTLIAGSFSIHDLKAPKATWRFAQMKNEEKIGFLAALASKDPAPVPLPKPDAAPGTFFHIVNADLADLSALFDFPAWGLELRNARASASLIQSTVDPKNPIFGFDAGPILAEGGGWLRILEDNVIPFDKVAINRVATTQDRPDDILLELKQAETGQSRLVGKGFFTGIYGETSVPGIDLHVELLEAADALQAVVAGKKIEGVVVSGKGAKAVIDLKDKFEALKVAATFSALDAQYEQYRALGIGFGLAFDGGAGKVGIKDFAFGAPLGGRFELDAGLSTETLRLDATVALRDFRTDSYLPAAVRPLGGGKLSGRVVAAADLTGKSAHIKNLDLRLQRTRAAGLPPTIRVFGDARLAPERVSTSGLNVEVVGARVTAKGSLDLERQLVQLGLEVLAADLAKLLGTMGLPPLAKDARLSASVGGTLRQPTVDGDAVVHGAGTKGRTVPELKAKFGLRDGIARLDSLSGAAFGGTMAASGQLQLYTKNTDRMLRSPVVDATVSLQKVDLGQLVNLPEVAGRVSLEAHAQGPLDHVAATVAIPAGNELRLYGDDYRLGPVDLGFADNRLDIKTLRVTRKAGGALEVKGTVTLPRNELALEIVASKIPLAGLPGIADAGVALTGNISAHLNVAGTPERPLLAGDVVMEDVVARGVPLGGGKLTLQTTTGPEGPIVTVVGFLFDRFHVDGKVALGPRGPGIHGVLEFQRMALEALAPELMAFGDGRGVTSGRVTVDLEPGKPLAVDVLLSELWLSIARAVEGDDGETTFQRLRVEAKKPIHATVRGDTVVLDEARFATDGGEFHAQGRLDPKGIQGDIAGHLNLELLQPFLRGNVEKISGDLKVELTARGTMDKPILRGKVDIASPVHVRPVEFDSEIVVGGGSFLLDETGVQVQAVTVTVEGSTMRLSGSAALGPGFQPTDVAVNLDGDISARLLPYVAADAISDASGRARLRATLRGTLKDPKLNGRLDLGTITFRMRDLGTVVEVQSGIIEVDNSGLVLRDVRVRLDDHGLLVIGASGVRAGQVAFNRLFPFEPGEIDLPLHGERLAYRSPEKLEIDDLAFDLDLIGDVESGFTLGGEVRLVSGRYLQDFKMQQLVISPRVNESSVRPFYEDKPLLEGLELDLGVRTVGEGFVVQNNLAPEIHVDVVLHVGGTLAEPRLGGGIRPTDGRFALPGMRGEFDLTPNVSYVTFVETKSIEYGDTPDLNIEAQNLITDASGNEHTVRMRIHGPLREAQIDLSTDGGLDRNQTAMLLLTGRTSNETQRFGTQNPTVGANINTGADVAGQLTRDTIANLMEPYIDDTFFRMTGFNLRLTVGPDGFEGRVRKRISRYVNFQADTLFGFQSQSRQTAHLNLWVIDYLTLAAGVERITLSSQQGVSETLAPNYNLELRWDFAIRR